MARSAVLFAAVVACGAAAAPALAAPEGPASGICVVKHVPNVRPTTVKVGVNIGEASSKAADAKADCSVVSGVVKTLARSLSERPMTVSGYACTPTVRGTSRVSWRCVWTGGSPRTNVTALFAWRYVN
jgi:hypothetical protein